MQGACPHGSKLWCSGSGDKWANAGICGLWGGLIDVLVRDIIPYFIIIALISIQR
jgi:hypothetical protein